MSLKSMVKKSIASVMAIYMVFGNIAIAGIGLGKVIAEDAKSPEVVIQSQVQKYIPYENEVGKGVVLQEKISIAQESTAETYMPVEKVEMEIQVPSLKEVLPSRVSIITASTLASNGKVKGEISQNYNAETGLLNIAYENTEDYNKYQENEKDEFEIIYIYPAEANTTEELEITRTIKGKIEYKTENGTVTSENSETIEATVQEKVGEITSYETISASEIYKGYMYANQNNKANHVTAYKTTGKISVLNSEIIDETQVTLQASKYQGGEEEQETNTIVYKTSKIAEDEFKKIYGEQGYIEIYTGETKYASIKYEEIEGRKVYKTIYHVENAPENTEAGKVEYAEGTTEVTIKTSKPQTEGTIKIENEKEIKAVEDYGIKVEEIEKISEDNNITSIKKYEVEEEIKDENGQLLVDEEGNVQKQIVEKTITIIEKASKGTISLKEPTAQMKLEMSNINLSTLATNETKLTITLNDTNSSCTLYEAGQIEIDLPENITDIKITNAKILYGNGIEITKASISEGKLILAVEGKQTSYDTENISGGVNIVIDLEIDIDDTVPSHQETLEVVYGKAKTSTKVNIVSKYGILMLSNYTGYDNENSVIKSIDNAERTIEIEHDADSKTIINTLNLINNYEEKISNVQIVGKIDSTFEAKLQEEIKVTGAEAKVYYSENINANILDDSWIQEFNANAKLYKVVLTNNEIGSKEVIQIESKVNIPENVGYNQEAHLKTEINYKYNNISASDSSNLCMKTEKQKIKKIETTLDIGSNIEDFYRYDVGEQEIFLINVKNIISEDLNNIKVIYKVPEELELINAGSIEYVPYEGYSIIESKGSSKNGQFECIIDNLKAGAEETIGILLKVKQLTDEYVKDIDSIAQVEIDNETYTTNIKTISTAQAGFTIELSVDTKEKDILQMEDTIEYIIKAKNNGKRSRAVNIKTTIPQELNVLKLESYFNGNKEEEKETFIKNIELTKVLSENDELIIKVTGQVRAMLVEEETILNILNSAILVDGKNEIKSNEVEIKIKPEVEKVESPEEPVEPEKPVEPETPEEPVEPEKPVEPETPEEPVEPEQPAEPETPEEPSEPEVPEQPTEPETPEEPVEPEPESTYSILGLAWLDSNKNGKKDEDESVLEGITVTLIDSTTGKTVKDEQGNNISVVTNSAGTYTFSNIKKGTYLVIFEFDTKKYAVTTYNVEAIEENLNSDAILKAIELNGETKEVGITDNIELTNSDIANLDIGLIENANFDLSLEKTIKNITVITPQGTKIKEYKNKNFVKLDLVAKYMNSTEVIITYKFIIKNEGDTIGYVEELVDNLPSGLEFSSELNKDWYKGTDGKLYTTSLTGLAINPGGTSEVELVLTKTMTEESTGTFSNNAELTKTGNLGAIEETEKENNRSSADLLISIKTGSVMMYIGISLGCAAIIAVGAYIIKNKILDKENI